MYVPLLLLLSCLLRLHSYTIHRAKHQSHPHLSHKPRFCFLNPRCWWLFYCAMSISATREASRIKARHLTPQYSYSTIVQYSRNQQASPPLHSLPKNQKAYMSSSQHHSSGINSPSIYSHIHTSHVTHQCQPLPLRNLISKSP